MKDIYKESSNKNYFSQIILNQEQTINDKSTLRKKITLGRSQAPELSGMERGRGAGLLHINGSALNSEANF